MAWWNKKKTKVQGYAEQDNTGQWLQYFSQYMANEEIEKFDPSRAYKLATTLAEIYIPIDAIADRVASINFRLIKKSTGEEYEPTGNLKRLIEQPNPVDRFNDLVYKSVFSDYSVGESFIYTKIPDRLVTPTADNIQNVWVLNPEFTKAKLRKEVPNPFSIKDREELIEYYKTFFLVNHNISPKYITHRAISGLDEKFNAVSPLCKSARNINNLLAVYQARYNVYAKNGNGGILSRDSKKMGDLQEAVDPVQREAIVQDLNNRNGITGNKNFIGISAIPLKFIKTLGTISELMPFEETEADMVTIGATMGVNKYLLPLKEGTTFTNQTDAEKQIWQNVIKGLGDDKAKDLTKAFALPEGVIFEADYSHIEALQEDKKTALESDSLLIDNLAKLTEAGQDVKQAYDNITEKYNS